MVLSIGMVPGRVGEFIRRQYALVTEINRKYATPRIAMSRWTKLSLLFLRLYLIFLVILLGYRFLTMLSGGRA
ncbi:MAG TPA: hypothetical protein VLV30_04055 [Methanomicrobiales archaeon]|nr:hypothetical protein [Methanomicrobiales archaeon]